MKCKIEWIDEKGIITSDDNEAVCLAVSVITRNGMEERQSFPCCEQHRERMRKMKPWRAVDYYPRFTFLGDQVSKWVEEPLPECVNCGMIDHPLGKDDCCQGCLCLRCGKSAVENGASMNDMGWCNACEVLLKTAITSGMLRHAPEVKDGNDTGASG